MRLMLIYLVFISSTAFGMQLTAASSAFSGNHYFFRGDDREPEKIFNIGFTINPNKDCPQKTENFGSGPEYLAFSSSFMAAAAFPFIATHETTHIKFDISYVYIISKEIQKTFDIQDFMKESVENELSSMENPTENFLRTFNRAVRYDGQQFSIGIRALGLWQKILFNYWPKEMVIKDGAISPEAIIGAFCVERTKAPYADSANIIMPIKFIANMNATQRTEENFINMIITGSALLNASQYNPILANHMALGFFLALRYILDSEDSKKITAEHILKSLDRAEDFTCSCFSSPPAIDIWYSGDDLKETFIHRHTR